MLSQNLLFKCLRKNFIDFPVNGSHYLPYKQTYVYGLILLESWHLSRVHMLSGVVTIYQLK